MKNNPIQFAVVREDPQIEMDLIEKFRLDRATLIGSGGCTAFCLKSFAPHLQITLIEPNPAQIELIKEKVEALKKGQFEKFGIGSDADSYFIECGNFESLFRQFREFIYEFVAARNEIENGFINYSNEFWTRVFENKYWNVAFELFFSDSILVAMFTEAAIQHAPQNSYPPYFQTVLEKGLLREDAPRNYFLHHIFLGHYLIEKSAQPFYLTNLPENFDLEFFNGFAQDFRGYDGKQLIHFSNIFDWCEENLVGQIISSAAENLEKGSVVSFRQLNNDKNYRLFFGDDFRWLPTERIVENDRSLFYTKIEIGEKIV